MPPKKPISYNEWKIYSHAKLPSTNDLARELVNANHEAHKTVIVASQQSAGRGSKGRVWEGLPKSSLLTSIITDKININPYWLTLYISLLVTDSLSKKYPHLNLHVKWLNDIYLDNLKLGGILIEKVKDRYIIGIGLNIHKQKIISSYLGKYISDMTAMDVLKLILNKLDEIHDNTDEDNHALFNKLFQKYNIFEHSHFEITINNEKYNNLVYHGIDELGKITFWDGDNYVTIADTDTYKIEIGKIKLGL